MRYTTFSLFYFYTVVFTLLTTSTSLSAAENAYLTELQESAHQQRLWQKTEWLNLVHYVRKSDVDFKSPVADRAFFTSKTGSSNPQFELHETLAAYFRRDVSGNDHPQCIFIARLRWLKLHLNIDLSALPHVVCSDYLAWRKMVQAQQVTLVFPAYHLNSPSSMFGHTLLRLDPINKDGWSEWLSFAVNFGADLNTDENSLFYAYKGLTGGYPGKFNVSPYFKKIKEYTRTENRDIWEYRLDLTAEETERLIIHLWELKDINFDYYFFDENCSFRLLELLEVARPGVELTDGFALTAIPIDTVRAVEHAGMIESVAYRPSQATVLNYSFNRLLPDDQAFVKILAADPEVAQSPSFVELSVNRRRAIIDTAYKYLRFQKTAQVREATSAKNSYQLLVLLNSYPAQAPIQVPASADPPEKSHLSKRLSLGIGERDGEAYAQFGLRMAFHGLIDGERGFLHGAQINMGDLQFRADNAGKVDFQQFDIINIFSLTPRTPLIEPWSWRIRTGFERQGVDLAPSLIPYVDGGAGVAYGFFSDGISYALVTTRLESNSDFNHTIEPGLGLTVGALYHASIGSARIELNSVKFANGVVRFNFIYEQNIVLARNHAITLVAKRDKISDIGVTDLGFNYQYYFD